MPERGDPSDSRGTALNQRRARTPTTADLTGGSTASQALVSFDGLIPVVFGASNLAASQAAVELHTVVPAATPTGIQAPFVAPFRGSIGAITFTANDDKTAGTAAFTVYVNDVATTATVSWATGARTGYAVFPRDQAVFLAGAEIDVRVTTDSAYAPTTTEAVVTVLLGQDPSTVL